MHHGSIAVKKSERLCVVIGQICAYGSGVVSRVELKWVCVFAQSIQARRIRQSCAQPEVLGLEDEACGRRVE
jgi:starvation-inducible outer membrane lipoprotein